MATKGGHVEGAAEVAGQQISMGGSSSYLRHADAVGSTTMVTDQAGNEDWDVNFYPWGQSWQQTGSRYWNVFGDMGFENVNDVDFARHRAYQATLGRWLTPDPAGEMAANLANPQTWNMYAYVGDNPTTLNDPSGLDWVDIGNCSYDQISSYVSIGNGPEVPTGTFILASAGVCSGIADGDAGTGPIPDTSYQYQNREEVYVAAELAQQGASRDVPLTPAQRFIFSHVYQSTKSLRSPWFPVAWYGASGAAGLVGEEILSEGAATDLLEEAAAPYGPQINAAGQFTRGLLTSQPVTTVPGLVGRAVKIGLGLLSNW